MGAHIRSRTSSPLPEALWTLDLRPDGSFHLDMSYFDFAAGLRMTNERPTQSDGS